MTRKQEDQKRAPSEESAKLDNTRYKHCGKKPRRSICSYVYFEDCHFCYLKRVLLYLDSHIHFYTFPTTSYFSHQFEAHSQTINENRKVCFIYYF